MHPVSPSASADRPAAVPAPVRVAATAPASSFAQLLQRGQATHGALARAAAPQPEAPPVASADGQRDDRTPSEAEQTRRLATTKAAAKASARLRDKEHPSAPSTGEARGDAGEAAAPSRPAARDDPNATAPALALNAADLRATGGPAHECTLPATNEGVASALADGSAANAAAADEARREAQSLDASAQPEPAGLETAGAAGLSGASAEPAATAAASRPMQPDSATAREPAPALPVGIGMPLGRGVEIGAPAPVALPAALQSPEFASQLAAQVSVWVGDGVQQAELHLNPAEMGPISVRIQIDGDQARVAFAADAVLTREVIERGLPELASALREQGLTLSGGGVFQQQPGSRGEAHDTPAGSPGRSRRLLAGSGAPGLRTIALPALQGQLDVYA